MMKVLIAVCGYLATTAIAGESAASRLGSLLRPDAPSGRLGRRVPDLPGKIRGVNLGGWLVSEPWMLGDEWKEVMGCGNAGSEFDCVLAKGQDAADESFDAHYARWITPDDIQKISDYGLNTIRIPIGYWSYRDIVDGSESFPQMNLKHLDAVIEKAASLNMFVVMDLHGAPGAQKVNDAFTGQLISTSNLPAFFTSDNYDRATKWLAWMAHRIHTTDSYKATVGIVEVVNEPQTSRDEGGIPQQEKDTLTQHYYPQALAAVRAEEDRLGVGANDRLHVQFMDDQWGAGDPKSNLPQDGRTAFDDHNYIGGAVASEQDDPRQGDYMYYSCFKDDRLADGQTPKIVQEFSLTVDGAVEDSDEFSPDRDVNAAFYKQWWIAQQRLYEKTNGWIFWSWKTGIDNPRWSYSKLVSMGWIADSAQGLDASSKRDVCNEYFPNGR